MSPKKTNKKISFFIPTLDGGGAERVFTNLANYISQKEYLVDLVLVQKEGPYLNLVSNKINIIDLNSSRLLKSLFPLIKYLKKEKPDILISTLTHPNIIAIIAKLISGASTKIMIRQSNYFSLSVNKKIKVLCKFFYKKPNVIIAISKDLKKDLIKTLKIPKQKIKVLYNPVFEKSILQKAEKKPNHPFLKNKNNKIILGVGRLVKEKNFSTLIRAFNKLEQKRGNIKLIILGEGKKKKKIEGLIKKLKLTNKVSMPGFVGNPYSYMKKADILVLSSIREGFGNVIVEALTCGTPIVSTNCPGGPKEILKNGKYGKLVPIGNTDALAKAIEETLDNPIDSEKLLGRAKDFSIEKIAEQYLQTITKLMEK